MSHTLPALVSSPEKKAAAKAALQGELSWPVEPRRAVVCITGGMTDANGELLEALLPGLMTLPIQLLILGKGSEHFGKLCTQLAKQRPHQVAIIPNNDDAVESMLNASDIALFCTAPKKDQVASCLEHGIVAVSAPAAGLSNYNPNQESGNAFIADDETIWHSFAALVRALETYKFPFDWKTIQRNALEGMSEEE